MLVNKEAESKTKGWINGFIGVLMFSGSLPATKIAVLEFSPIFLTAARASIAGALAISALLLFRAKRPKLNQLYPLLIVVIGVVLGFPLLSALALQHISSAHSLVFIGLLPIATAIFGIIRGGENPRPIFWLFSLLGSILVVGYAASQGLAAIAIGDAFMLGAIVLCGLGYAEGAKLTKALGDWQVISWALVLALPVMLALMFAYKPKSFDSISTSACIGLAYISLFSMFIGFIFWYKGLALGGTAQVGQLQLLQPFFGLALAAYFLHEHISLGMLLVTIGVILCVLGTKKFAK